MDEYFCPQCGAILNEQIGFSPECGAWTCTNCGEMLMDDDVYDGDEYEGVAWFCDNCGALLNKQDDFSDSYGSWICTQCGYSNGITDDDIIDKEDDLWKCTEYNTEEKILDEDDGPKCPSCSACLKKQCGFYEYEDDWQCTECGANLHRDYYLEEFSVKKEEGPKCPSCSACLKKQCGFYEYENDWKCTECGANLHRNYSFEEFSVQYEEENSEYDNEEYDDENEEEEYQDEHKEKSNSIIEKLKKIVKSIIKNEKIEIGINSSDWIGNSVKEVRRNLKEKGFINVNEQPVQDIYVDNVEENGKVERVIVNAKIDFNKNEKFPYDTPILIIYHTKKKIEFPYSSKQVYKKNCKELVKELKELGFTQIETKKIKDLVTGWIVKDESIEEVIVENSNSYKQGFSYEYDAKIIIKYHTFRKK